MQYASSSAAFDLMSTGLSKDVLLFAMSHSSVISVVYYICLGTDSAISFPLWGYV